MIHNHSGKIADLSTVRKSTQPHNLRLSTATVQNTKGFAAVLLLQHLPGVGTLAEPTLENPKYNTRFSIKEKKEAQKYSVLPFSEALL